MDVWIVSCNPEPGDECDWEHAKRATFVSLEVFVLSDRIDDAIPIGRSVVESVGFIHIEVDRCVKFEVDDWDEENDPDREVRDMASAVVASGVAEMGTVRWTDEQA